MKTIRHFLMWAALALTNAATAKSLTLEHLEVLNASWPQNPVANMQELNRLVQQENTSTMPPESWEAVQRLYFLHARAVMRQDRGKCEEAYLSYAKSQVAADLAVLPSKERFKLESMQGRLAVCTSSLDRRYAENAAKAWLNDRTSPTKSTKSIRPSAPADEKKSDSSNIELNLKVDIRRNEQFINKIASVIDNTPVLKDIDMGISNKSAGDHFRESPGFVGLILIGLLLIAINIVFSVISAFYKSIKVVMGLQGVAAPSRFNKITNSRADQHAARSGSKNTRKRALQKMNPW